MILCLICMATAMVMYLPFLKAYEKQLLAQERENAVGQADNAAQNRLTLTIQRIIMELEEQVMGIIINAGQSRSLCYEALHAAKAGDFATADAKMQEAAHYSREAHLVQTQLIEADEGEGKTKMTLVMVHAQDHLMTSILAKELIAELIAIYRAQPLHA
ncbi:PTS system cellobiose-specific transporter subunit IIA [Klebsiella pneumoniae]|nr:PTS system cellobiose-specific transporter subunit IIA [Klebsiella pneumoniae]